jgi:hypothetical protein
MEEVIQNFSKIRIAFIKSSLYQDLWVSEKTTDYVQLFKTSMMRCPSLGFAKYLNAEFFIVKDTDEYPCNINKNCLPVQYYDNMKYSKKLKNPTLPFLDETFHADMSIDSVAYDIDRVDWEKYNIVICINTCIPNRIIEKYSNVFWCYYIGENDDYYIHNKVEKYNLFLNQDVCQSGLPSFSIGMPYSLLGPVTLENLYYDLNPGCSKPVKKGIFMEINNTTERPVVNIPYEFIQISNSTKQPIYRHEQNIVSNLNNLVKSKYFVKLLGRKLRGNSILETVSAGTLILANKNLVVFSNLILDECHVENFLDVTQTIIYFENNPEHYNHLVYKQRELLYFNYFKYPLENLNNKYLEFVKNK